MYVGLYDQDLILGKTKVFPSFEMMLLSSYYKKDGIVELIFDLKDIDRFDLVYVNRNRSAKDTIPYEIFYNPKITWFGQGITGKYIPIEKKFYKELPDRSLYKNYFLSFYNDYSTRKKTIIKKMLDHDYVLLRITNGDELLVDLEDINYINKKIILIDENIFLNQFYMEILNKLKGNQVYFLNCQKCKDLKAFNFMIDNNFRPADRNRRCVSYHGPLNNKDFIQLFPKLSSAYIIGIEAYSGNENSQTFILNQFIQKGKFVLYGRANNKTIQIMDSPDNKEIACPEYSVLNRFCTFSQQTGLTANINFLTYSQRFGKIFIEARNKMCKNSEIYTIMNSNLNDIHKRGVWKL